MKDSSKMDDLIVLLETWDKLSNKNKEKFKAQADSEIVDLLGHYDNLRMNHPCDMICKVLRMMYEAEEKKMSVI